MILDFPTPTGVTPRQMPSSPVPLPPRPSPEAGDDATGILAAAAAILNQGEDLLRSIGQEAYTTRVPAAFNGSIGSHYRHCLDHFVSLLRSLETDIVDYDRRDRDARIETDPAFALALTQKLGRELQSIAPSALSVPLNARCEVSYVHGDASVTGSTFGREVVYAIAHAIHHFALISVMAGLSGVSLPSNFGVAPSTLAHLARTGPSLDK